MRKAAGWAISLLFWCGLEGVLLSSASAETLTFASDDWCPYVCESSEDTHALAEKPGFLVEIAKTIFEGQGHAFAYKGPPWSRAIAYTRKGIYTALLGAMKSDAPDFIFPDEEAGENRMCFYVKSGDPWVYKGIDSLAFVTLGVVQDYAYDNGELDHYISREKSKVQAATSGKGLVQNFRKLKAGRIDALIDDSQVIRHLLTKQGWTADFQEAGCLERVKMYLAFSPALPGSRDYAKLFSEGIAEMRKSGKLQKILDSYGLSDWKR